MVRGWLHPGGTDADTASTSGNETCKADSSAEQCAPGRSRINGGADPSSTASPGPDLAAEHNGPDHVAWNCGHARGRQRSDSELVLDDADVDLMDSLNPAGGLPLPLLQCRGAAAVREAPCRRAAVRLDWH